jgi:hypothetical protein
MRVRIRPAGALTAGLAAAALSCGAPAPPQAPQSPQTAPAASVLDFGTPEAPVFEPTLSSSNWEAWRDHVWPSADELAFEQIPWIPVLRDGVREADAQGKPLLVWMMNGHPLGCT